jgi:hypothetical protein
MVALDHLPNFRVVFEYLHRWNLELRFLPSFHFLKVYQNPLPCGVVIDDEDGASFPLDSGEFIISSALFASAAIASNVNLNDKRTKAGQF